MILWLLAACGSFIPDLPEGWEQAERVEDFEQAECNDTGTRALGAEADGDAVALTVDHIGARCGQDLEAWWQPSGNDGAEVLIQPVDMEAKSVAKCGCTYDVAMTVETPAPVTLAVYQRGDKHADEDPQPEPLGTVTVDE